MPGYSEFEYTENINDNIWTPSIRKLTCKQFNSSVEVGVFTVENKFTLGSSLKMRIGSIGAIPDECSAGFIFPTTSSVITAEYYVQLNFYEG